MSSTKASHASSFGMPPRTTVLPTYKSTMPGAPPTYPKSASAISPGPFTMQPMIAMVTPGKCPVLSEICAVTSWRSNNVLPQEGHDTNSVLTLRMREPCNSPNDAVRRNSTSKGASTKKPSTSPVDGQGPAVHAHPQDK